MALQPATMHFSLAAVPEPEREMALREIFGRGLVNMDFVPLTERPILEARVRLLPGVSVARGRHSPFLVTSHDISRENDDLMLAWPARPGKGLMTHLGREVAAEHGHAVLTSCADRCRSESHSEILPVNVRISRRLLSSLLPDAEDRLMRPIPADNPALRLLGDYVDLLLGQDSATSPELDHALALHVADLVALSVGATGEAREAAAATGGHAARLAVVKAWILKRLREPELCIARAAAAQRVSPRCIQMLFAAEGTTFSNFVLSARLALARRELCNSMLARTPISSVAYDCGFGDLSYFNRAFRKAFGATPSEIRERAMAEPASQSFASRQAAFVPAQEIG